MLVREVITNALRYIGVNTQSVENITGSDFLQNLRQLQLLVDTLRKRYPFKTTSVLSYSQLTNVPFVTIDSMVASTSTPSLNVRFPMEEISLDSYNNLVVYPLVTGVPRWYYFQKPNLVKIYPINEDYQYEVVGKINSALGLVANTELDPSPLFFQDFLEKSLAKRLAPFYTKEWTREREQEYQSCKENLQKNADMDYPIYSTDNNNSQRIYRARNYITH